MSNVNSWLGYYTIVVQNVIIGANRVGDLAVLFLITI